MILLKTLQHEKTLVPSTSSIGQNNGTRKLKIQATDSTANFIAVIKLPFEFFNQIVNSILKSMTLIRITHENSKRVSR